MAGRSHRWSVTAKALALTVLLSLPAAAYDHPVGPYEIREAYFLGRDSQRSVDFLTLYAQAFSPPQDNRPFVTLIELRTPYAQIVENARQRSLGYTTQEAEEDYNKAGDVVQVRVQILYPLAPIQPPPGCEGATHMNDPLRCFHDFDFRFTQLKPVHPATTYGMSTYTGGDSPVFDGGIVSFTFPAEAIASAPLDITVTKADGQKASVTFDLMTLR